MNGYQRLDLLNLPLSGRRLIEASAGTGKTYAITRIVARLIMEKGLDVAEILVVTFTEKATKELRDRIRSHLSQLLSLFEAGLPRNGDGNDGDAEELAKLSENALAVRSEQEIRTALKKAVVRFDEAAIFTIHGFLNRLLRENAFESSVPFESELVTDTNPLVEEIIDDFFRCHVIVTPPIHSAILVKNNFYVEGFRRFAHTLIAMPLIQLVPSKTPEPMEDITAILGTMEHLFREQKNEIRAILYTSKALKRSETTYREDRLDTYFRELETLFSGHPTSDALSSIQMFSSKTIAHSLKQKQSAPLHPFFDLCDSFETAEKAFLIRIKIQFERFFKEELLSRKRSMNIQSFDDLLTHVWEILKKDPGAALCQAVKEKHRAILIDEFQDTDTLQYRIFDTLFGGPNALFFMIGDPKQSIYGFRGADIFSYINAVQKTGPACTHTLDENFRSETTLVEAVNSLFTHVKNPFALGHEIEFNPVKPSEQSKGNKKPLLIDGERVKGLAISLFMEKPSDGNRVSLSKEKASLWGEAFLAHEIKRLLTLSAEGRATLGGAKISPSDIAILVTRNQDALEVKEVLGRAGIPSVVTKAGSVFHTKEATEILCFLLAAGSPGDLRRINGALCLDMIGFSASNFQGFMEDESQEEIYDAHLKRFHHYHNLWREKGFIRMFREALADYSIRETLLKFPDGERRLGNLLQLVELIHTASLEKHLGVNGVIQWLSETRLSLEENEAEELRLEHDKAAVQILTVFKSKGLQFPIVFCPFMWRSGALIKPSDQKHLIYHDSKGVYLHIAPEQREEAILEKAVTERLSELMRLLYVGLTRALNRCYLVTGNIGKFSLTSIDYLFSGGEEKMEGWIHRISENMKQRDDAVFEAAVNRFHSFSQEMMEIIRMEAPPALPDTKDIEAGRSALSLNRRVASVRFKSPPVITSYSALMAGAEALTPSDESNLLKRDEKKDTAEENLLSPASGFFAFPRGAIPGTCIHEIFEAIDFTFNKPAEARPVIQTCLERYNLLTGDTGLDQTEPVLEMIKNVISAPLNPEIPDFSLDRIPLSDRINEMAFYYPLNPDSSFILESIYPRFGRNGGASAAEGVPGDRLTLKPVQGFMQGYIDLVFRFRNQYYIIDWKTNHLGNTFQDYPPERLSAYMRHALYDLQYHIYTLALHLYLSKRDPSYRYDTGFGGVFYLFVRGVSPSHPACGIYFNKPDLDLIEKMSAMCVRPEGR